jgi:hypothetical protein
MSIETRREYAISSWPSGASKSIRASKANKQMFRTWTSRGEQSCPVVPVILRRGTFAPCGDRWLEAMSFRHQQALQVLQVLLEGYGPTVHDLLFHFARSRGPFVALVLIHKVPQNHIEAGLGGGRTGSTLQWPEQRQSTYSSPDGSTSDGTEHLARSRSLVLGSWACPDVFKHQFLEGVELRSVL